MFKIDISIIVDSIFNFNNVIYNISFIIFIYCKLGDNNKKLMASCCSKRNFKFYARKSSILFNE